MLKKFAGCYNFEPLNNFLETIYPEIEKECIEQDDMFTTINIELKNGMKLKTIISSDSEKKNWISFYLKNNSLNIEQIDFMINDSNSDVEYNRVIRHDYYIEDEIATTFNSAYSYFGNNYLHGWEQKRKVNFSDIEHYAGHDNLANFSCHIDNSHIDIFYREDNYLAEEPDIKFVMLTKQKVKLLEKNVL